MNQKERQEYNKNYYANVIKTCQEKNKKHIANALRFAKSKRYRAMQKIAGETEIRCSVCGCSFYPLLEINHKNGGGTYETSIRGIQGFYADIVNNKRTVEDLEVTCKLCNIHHFIKLKYPNEGNKFKVVWDA